MHTRSSLLRKSLLLPNCSVHSSVLHVIPNSSRKTTLLEAGPKSECPGHTARHVMQCVSACAYAICNLYSLSDCCFYLCQPLVSQLLFYDIMADAAHAHVDIAARMQSRKGCWDPLLIFIVSCRCRFKYHSALTVIFTGFDLKPRSEVSS